MEMNHPLPACLFQKKRDDGKDCWVQFKYERLSDFCYKCRALEHVIWRCPFRAPATITSVNGIVAKLYGHWLQAEHHGSLLFIDQQLEVEKEIVALKEKRMLEKT